MSYQVFFGYMLLAQFDTYEHAMVLYNYGKHAMDLDVRVLAVDVNNPVFDFTLQSVECAYIIKAKVNRTV